MIKGLRNLGFAIIAIVGLWACEDEADPTTQYPDTFLPAYPGSFWDYTNGERVLTSPTYELHSYETSINSTEKSSETYVPVYNGQYLYTYSVHQSSTTFPLKKLLEETKGSSWTVNEANNSVVKREVVDRLVEHTIPFPPFTNPVDCVFSDVVVVVEYIDSLGVDRWSTKEYYADSVGLIQVEINNPFDTAEAVIQKQIQGYSINW